MTEIERIKKTINWIIFCGKAKNMSEICEELGYKKSSLSQILNGKVPVSDRFIENLLMLDNNINKVWIRTGKGKMLLTNSSIGEQNITNYGDGNASQIGSNSNNIQIGNNSLGNWNNANNSISISGSNNSVNPNDVAYLQQLVFEKDAMIKHKEGVIDIKEQIIVKLRQDIEKQHTGFVHRLDEKEKYYHNLAAEKDKRNDEKDKVISELYAKNMELNERIFELMKEKR